MAALLSLLVSSLVALAAAHETLDADAHARSVARKGWQPVGPHPDPARARLRLTVALRQRNLDDLQRRLHALSDPDSPAYGQFLSRAQVDDLVAPAEAHLGAVARWLAAHPHRAATRNSDFVTVDVTVAEAEQLLGGAQYFVYENAETGQQITRLAPGTTYRLPDDVRDAVDFVGPTLTFPPPQQVVGRRARRGRPAAKPAITPPRLRALANLTDAQVGKGPDDASGVKQGVASFLGQEYAAADLLAFRKKYALSTDGLDTLLVAVPAGQKHDNVGVEASMDVQYITSTGNEILTEHWSTKGAQPGNPENEPFVAWLTSVAAAADPPSVFSISYGDEETGVSYEYAQRCSVEFQKAGARGITLLAASGDSGVGCGTAGFIPTFPASCPYVTGVGAVQGGTPGRAPTGESVADLSGGGFSNYFARPQYQDDAVAAYTQHSTGLPPQRNWNATGAGFPDIAGQGILFDVCTEDFFYPYSGTSAACPSEAGLVALLQQSRADANMTKLGWLNPLLYKVGAEGSLAFNDVTDGTNTCCGDDTGFSAAKGWDPVSGWGTINYGNMLARVMAAAKPVSLSAGNNIDTQHDDDDDLEDPLHPCKTDADCSNICSYCLNGAGKVPPFVCHAPQTGCCTSDVDCAGSCEFCVLSPPTPLPVATLLTPTLPHSAPFFPNPPSSPAGIKTAWTAQTRRRPSTVTGAPSVPLGT